MATTPDAQNLKLSVTDFGPIAKAKIDLRPLTVFVGPSNTGKSYMAVLIYALHKFFSAYSGRKDFRSFSHVKRRQNLDLSEHDLSSLYAWAKETLSKLETTEHERPYSIELPESIAALVRPMLNNIAHLSENLEGEITRCFGIDKAKNLIRHSGNGETTFSLLHNISKETELNNPFGYQVTVTEQGAKINASIPNAMPLQMDIKDLSALLWNWNIGCLIEMEKMGWRKVGSAEAANWNVDWLVEMKNMGEDENAKHALIYLLRILANSIALGIVGPLSHSAYYLPADRGGVMHAHRVVVQNLITSASRRDSPMPVLSGVLGDFLGQLVSLTSFSSMHGESQDDNDLALRMEKALLRGTVHVERSEIDYPSFVYRPEGWEKDLPLMNASSMVSELAPVVLYLRHMVQPGDLLIIEEPESHLHPEMQVAFIRQLAVAVKSGIRILLTTHSEWVLEGLANIVRLSELPEARRKGIASADFALGPDDVGVWRFERSLEERGSVVNQSLLDVEFGTFPSGFGDISEDAYNEYAEISSRIEDSK